jgi:hypothetical protein
MSMIAFRTDDQIDEKLRRAAREQKTTKTEIIREALEFYFDSKTGTTPARVSNKRVSLADILKPDIGTWDGPADSSLNTGKQLRDIFGAKDRPRRV